MGQALLSGVMKYLLDSSVVNETVHAKSDPTVIAWPETP
jgi:hypothetical protein